VRIFKDNVDDLWVEHADGTLICVAEGVRQEVHQHAWSGRAAEDVERGYGPLVELVPADGTVVQR
jgi:CelD/BcsL family acetyltransferase involved in cellulose biosynthesis